MLIQNRQWMATPGKRCEMALEVHLPKLVGGFMLKALPGRCCLALHRLNAAMSVQNMSDGAGGHPHLLVSCQYMRNFAPSPGRAFLAQGQHGFLQGRRALPRTVPWTTRAVMKRFPVALALFRTRQPLVARLAANSITLA